MLIAVCWNELSISVEDGDIAVTVNVKDLSVTKSVEELSITKLDNTGDISVVLIVSIPVLKVSVLVSNSLINDEYIDILDADAANVDIVSTDEAVLDIFKFIVWERLSLSTFEDTTKEFITELLVDKIGML